MKTFDLTPLPLDHFSAWIGVDHNGRTRGGQGSISFAGIHSIATVAGKDAGL